MRIIFAAILLCWATLVGYAQNPHQPKLEHLDNSKMQKQIDSSMRELDSMNERLNEGIKQTMQATDSINNHLRQEQNDRNLDAFMLMHENEAKAKKAMWI